MYLPEGASESFIFLDALPALSPAGGLSLLMLLSVPCSLACTNNTRTLSLSLWRVTVDRLNNSPLQFILLWSVCARACEREKWCESLTIALFLRCIWDEAGALCWLCVAVRSGGRRSSSLLCTTVLFVFRFLTRRHTQACIRLLRPIFSIKDDLIN